LNTIALRALAKHTVACTIASSEYACAALSPYTKEVWPRCGFGRHAIALAARFHLDSGTCEDSVSWIRVLILHD
jgi:hypothetical protein